MNITVHIISHSHWDREWYMPFEYHRANLIKLIDNCIELFENDKEYKSFCLDGHTVLLEDYLEIKPENCEKIEKYVKEGKFKVGPWYVLQDEFLTSSEANIRNLLIGTKISEKFGKITKIGYFPDSFGNAGQMPQILKQAGMKAIVFGRGVKPTGANNTVSEGYASQFSEMFWQSPDGSKLPAILFANWYHNGMEIPEDGNKEYWNRVLSGVEKYASTGELLVMNGCDHQPVQKNLSKAIASAKKSYPEYTFVHSNFEDYTDALLKTLPENVQTITGELIGQDTDGWFTLVNTCSAHVDLKVMNKKCETLLENVAEPLSVIAMNLGKKYPHEMLEYSWKTLMKNHPHDSICGCSCDEVNEEMKTRFMKSKQSAEAIIGENLEYISKHIDISGFEECDTVFAVINTFGKMRNSLVNVDVDLRRIYDANNLHGRFMEINDSLSDESFELVDTDGNIIPCSISNHRACFGYDLPDDRFRQPYVAETVTISFEACDLAPMGYNVYGLRKADKELTVVDVCDNTLENEYLKATINTDGTVNVLHKATGKFFTNLINFEDVGDIGSEYTFIPVPDDTPIYPDGDAEIELSKNEVYVTEYKVTIKMNIPEAADNFAEFERNSVTFLKNRKGGRSKNFVTIPVTYYISLAKNSKRLDLRVEFDNAAKDHRMRVIFPTGLNCTKHKAESVFEAALRNNRHNDTWTYPSGCEHQQGFVMMNEEDAGLAVANKGLYEYEITVDNAIAVTLVRAVAELGDWGVFPTKLSQQQKKLSLELSIIPFDDDDTVYTESASFLCPVTPFQVFENGEDDFKNNQLIWQGKDIKMTAFKAAQNSNDIIMRFVNYSAEDRTLTINKTDLIDNVMMSDVLEADGDVLAENCGVWTVNFKPYEIVTLKIRK